MSLDAGDRIVNNARGKRCSANTCHRTTSPNKQNRSPVRRDAPLRVNSKPGNFAVNVERSSMEALSANAFLHVLHCTNSATSVIAKNMLPFSAVSLRRRRSLAGRDRHGLVSGSHRRPVQGRESRLTDLFPSDF